MIPQGEEGERADGGRNEGHRSNRNIDAHTHVCIADALFHMRVCVP